MAAQAASVMQRLGWPVKTPAVPERRVLQKNDAKHLRKKSLLREMERHRRTASRDALSEYSGSVANTSWQKAAPCSSRKPARLAAPWSSS
jgi:hypothetical protein